MKKPKMTCQFFRDTGECHLKIKVSDHVIGKSGNIGCILWVSNKEMGIEYKDGLAEVHFANGDLLTVKRNDLILIPAILILKL